MNSYERVMTALRFEEPDKVPISEFMIHKNVYQTIMPEAMCQDDFVEAMGLDVVSARAQYREVSGDSSSFVDEWGITYLRNKEQVPHNIKGPIEKLQDLSKLNVPDPDAQWRMDNLEKLVKLYKGKRAIAFNLRAMFTWSTMLTAFDDLMTYMVTEPEFVEELFDRILEKQVKLAVNAVRAGADIIVETDDYAFNAGPLFSPAMFDQFIKPRMKYFCDAVHKEGGYVLKHSDGNTMKIMESMIEAGIDGFQGIDPLAQMDIGVMKEQFGDRISLWGNIDCGNLLTFGTIDQVREEVKSCIKKAAKGGGFVLMSCNSIPYSANPHNYKAMLDFAREYGNYPVAY
jgi:uroporphyrinogen decarboxylase